MPALQQGTALPRQVPPPLLRAPNQTAWSPIPLAAPPQAQVTAQPPAQTMLDTAQLTRELLNLKGMLGQLLLWPGSNQFAQQLPSTSCVPVQQYPLLQALGEPQPGQHPSLLGDGSQHFHKGDRLTTRQPPCIVSSHELSE